MKDIISRIGVIYFFMVLFGLIVIGRIVHLQFFADLPVLMSWLIVGMNTKVIRTI